MRRMLILMSSVIALLAVGACIASGASAAPSLAVCKSPSPCGPSFGVPFATAAEEEMSLLVGGAPCKGSQFGGEVNLNEARTDLIEEFKTATGCVYGLIGVIALKSNGKVTITPKSGEFVFKAVPCSFETNKLSARFVYNGRTAGAVRGKALASPGQSGCPRKAIVNGEIVVRDESTHEPFYGVVF